MLSDNNASEVSLVLIERINKFLTGLIRMIAGIT